MNHDIFVRFAPLVGLFLGLGTGGGIHRYAGAGVNGKVHGYVISASPGSLFPAAAPDLCQEHRAGYSLKEVHFSGFRSPVVTAFGHIESGIDSGFGHGQLVMNID